MLTLLNISNIALIDELKVEFEPGLNLLTGETGSGKSIIVDALGLLIGGRFAADMLKTGAEKGFVEGLFEVSEPVGLEAALGEAGIEVGQRDADGATELAIRREISAAGRSRIFINNQLATTGLLRQLRPFLVDIHGQGDQQTLFEPSTHLDLLDSFAGTGNLCSEVAQLYREWSSLKTELEQATRDEAEKLQLTDVLRFQIDELRRGNLRIGEEQALEEEHRRLANAGKIKTLGSESFTLIYEDNDSALTRLKQAERRIDELAALDPRFAAYRETIDAARAGIEDLAFALRDLNDKLEDSPERLAEVENRLADLTRLKRKYGGSVEGALQHLASAEEKLEGIEHAEERHAALRSAINLARGRYIDVATELHNQRMRWVKEFEQAVERDVAEVAIERARFHVQIDAPSRVEIDADAGGRGFTVRGLDRVEFLFSANPGETPKPLARVASGGEASRLMLVLKTVAGASEFPRTIVFDEIDSGIGGRVSEAVGAKLKRLSGTHQVLCVTHQPQIARFADAHHLVAKKSAATRTSVSLVRLDRRGRVEELARMLTGSEITETARRHARELLK
jgi:DNA repair protein RecN (Recombination protein N)